MMVSLVFITTPVLMQPVSPKHYLHGPPILFITKNKMRLSFLILDNWTCIILVMHITAWISARVFFTLVSTLIDFKNNAILDNFARQLSSPFQQSYLVLDIGSQDINGNLKTALYDSNFPNVLDVKYIGLDFEAGRNVDVVISPKDKAYPFLPNSVDVITSSSALEHDPRFWVTFLRMLMVLKPGGFLYISVPHDTSEHRYPVDCWRFYGDAGVALESWGQDNDYDISLIFTKTLEPSGSPDVDNVMIFYKKTENDNDESVQALKTHFEAYNELYDFQRHSPSLVIASLRNVQVGYPDDGIWAYFTDEQGNQMKITADLEILPV